MYCSYCGKEVIGGAAYCPFCGKPVQNFAQPYCTARTCRKVNGLSVAGFVIALASIAFGYLSVWINYVNYTGVNFQFLAVIPLILALALSIAGTVKSKKLKSGKGLGIAGIVISGLILGGSALYFLFAESLAKILFTFFMFLIPFI